MQSITIQEVFALSARAADRSGSEVANPAHASGLKALSLAQEARKYRLVCSCRQSPKKPLHSTVQHLSSPSGSHAWRTGLRSFAPVYLTRFRFTSIETAHPSIDNASVAPSEPCHGYAHLDLGHDRLQGGGPRLVKLNSGARAGHLT